MIQELFPTLSEFYACAPGVDSAATFAQLTSSGNSAQKQIENIITPAVYALVAPTGADQTLRHHLQMAVANLTMAKESVFDTMRKRKAGIDVYKHEQEAIRRAYYDNYYNAMDSLLQSLTEKNIAQWLASPYCLAIAKLKIKTTDAFDTIYPIDGSYLFFYRSIPFQKEIILTILSDYYTTVEALTDADKKASLLAKLDHALAKMTVAKALTRFDPMELPLTIRNLVEDTTAARQSSNEQSRIIEMAAELLREGNDLVSSVEISVMESTVTDVESQINYNLPEDKIYVIS